MIMLLEIHRHCHEKLDYRLTPVNSISYNLTTVKPISDNVLSEILILTQHF